MAKRSIWRNPRTDPVPEGLKRCTRCEIDFPPKEGFPKNAGRKDGLDIWCHTCVNIRVLRLAQIKKKTKTRKFSGNTGICEICGRESSLVYEHNHRTGKHRGWTCGLCNTALGMVGDSILVLKNMIAYLEKAGANR